MKVPMNFHNVGTFQPLTVSTQLRFGAFTGRLLASVMLLALVFAAAPRQLGAFQDQQVQQQPVDQSQSDQAQANQQSQGQAYVAQTPEQLQQLVAPIALYPDSLVAQILAATTFPAEIVEADRYIQANPNLKGDDLAKAVDQQNWDPSVKALTAFPSVLGNMDKNISWTSSLGDAYYNQQQDVMDAIQVMRQKAQDAGNLKTTPQQTVQQQGSTIVIQPADPQVVYVPAYNPWVVYGYPVVAWPGWYPYPGIWYGGPFLSFGFGFPIGFYGGYGWGWNSWGFNWHNHYVVYNHNTYYSNSRTFYNRNTYYHNGGERSVTNNVRDYNNHPENRTGYDNHGQATNRTADATRTERDDAARSGNVYNRPGATPKPFEGDDRAARGYSDSRSETNTRSGAFDGYDHGGESRGYSSRGASSYGGGGFGGGGFHGGGGGGGGRGGGGHR
jgi:hypothetical protein